jgi:hypothetical protein
MKVFRGRELDFPCGHSGPRLGTQRLLVAYPQPKVPRPIARPSFPGVMRTASMKDFLLSYNLAELDQQSDGICRVGKPPVSAHNQWSFREQGAATGAA